MYNLTDLEKELFQSQPWGVEITIDPVIGDDLLVTNEKLVEGSLTFDRYVATSEMFPIGTATAGELSFTLDNSDHSFDGVQFAGAKIDLKISIIKGNNQKKYLPIGKFTVDEAPRILESITLTALDAMVRFDMAVEPVFPTTVEALVDYLAGQANVQVATTLSTLPNYSYAIPAAPDNIAGMTGRQLLQYCCQIMGVNAQIDRDGELAFLQYPTSADFAIDESDRYSSDLRETISVTGVYLKSTNGNDLMNGEEGYVLEIKDNPLIQGDLTYPVEIEGEIVEVPVLDVTALLGITFTPYTAVIKQMPWLDPMDSLTFTKKEQDYPAFVTKMTQTINSNTAIEGTGVSETRKGYATIDPLTAREQQVLRDIRTRAAEAVGAVEQNSIAFSNVIANSLGLYDLSVKNEDGSTTYYFGDQETLSDCNVIYTFRSNGFAWTTDWNGGSPTWEGGISANGNAILRLLSLYKLTADQIDAGSITAEQLNITVTDKIFGGQAVGEVITSQTQGLQNQISANTSELSGQKDYIRIGALPDGTTGVAIGTVSGSNFIMGARFIKNELAFYDNSGNKVAWISSATLFIEDAEVRESLKMGGFRWQVEKSTGAMHLRWVGLNG